MKKNFFFVVLAMLFLAGTTAPLLAQAKLPDGVKGTVDLLYPDAEQIEWEDENDELVVYLIDEDYNVEITFDEEENWIQITTVIGESDLPSLAQTYLVENHSDTDVNNILKMRTRKSTMYFVNLETNSEIISLTFDETGNLVEKEAEDIDEDEN
ncbi:MAG: hypothetical protein AB8F74_08195 [Saprospiraceae bacterium]